MARTGLEFRNRCSTAHGNRRIKRNASGRLPGAGVALRSASRDFSTLFCSTRAEHSPTPVPLPVISNPLLPLTYWRTWQRLYRANEA